MVVWVLLIRVLSSAAIGPNENNIQKIDYFNSKEECVKVGKEIVDKYQVKSLFHKNEDGTPANMLIADRWDFQCYEKKGENK